MPRVANFTNQTDAVGHKHGLSKYCTFIVAAFARLAQVLTFLVFVKWGKRMRKASAHGHYRYVKEIAAAGLTHQNLFFYESLNRRSNISDNRYGLHKPHVFVASVSPPT
jgi:hypothetical protein